MVADAPETAAEVLVDCRFGGNQRSPYQLLEDDVPGVHLHYRPLHA